MNSSLRESCSSLKLTLGTSKIPELTEQLDAPIATVVTAGGANALQFSKSAPETGGADTPVLVIPPESIERLGHSHLPSASAELSHLFRILLHLNSECISIEAGKIRSNCRSGAWSKRQRIVCTKFNSRPGRNTRLRNDRRSTALLILNATNRPLFKTELTAPVTSIST